MTMRNRHWIAVLFDLIEVGIDWTPTTWMIGLEIVFADAPMVALCLGPVVVWVMW